MNVTLSWHELAIAGQVGVQRHVQAMAKGRKELYGEVPDGWGAHIEGAAAEMAVAKALDRYWEPVKADPSVGGDVGLIEVRQTKYLTGCLMLRRRDRPERQFVLAIGSAPSFRLAGWTTGSAGKHERFWREDLSRKPAWFVPQDALCSMEMFDSPVAA